MRLRGTGRVVVTGVGVVSPIGIGKGPFWNNLLAGRSGIRNITLFDTSGLRAQIAGEVSDFDPRRHLGFPIKAKRTARHTQLALAAAHEALSDAGLEFTTEEGPGILGPVLVCMGVTTTAFDIVESAHRLLLRSNSNAATPYVVSSAAPQAVATTIAEVMGVPSQALTVSTACAAGLDAIAVAANAIRAGQTDVAIAGGADSPICLVPYASLDAAGLASRLNETPDKASRPFDEARDSGVIAEGAGLLVLESLEHALGRGVAPYIEIAGFGMRTDPDLNRPACGLELSMRQAMANAAVLPEDIDYVSAWGPGHPVLDRIETEMIKKVFGPRAYSVPVTSIKGNIGNPLAAAGAIQAAAVCLAFREGMIPPTANLENPDPACDLDYVPGHPRAMQLKCAIINAHGIGGGNSSVVVTDAQSP